jgi:beta-glucosidase
MAEPHTPTSIFQNPALPAEQRAADLVSKMSLEEKVSQMVYDAPAINRLGVPAHNWWNECLHGVARAGIATVFPQAIGLAAAWNVDLLGRIAQAISDEARAKHHDAARRGNRGQYFGLTYWSPNINILRDPRWGRGQETYGEDPYLTARLGVTFTRGLQGDDPRYLKLAATPKHYAVHSGPEADRHHFDAVASQRDMRMTYLPAFEACVREAKAESIMGAYNRVNGEPACASQTLLQKILREEWGFEGYVVSDCGAIKDIYAHHRVVKTAAEAAALAVRNGCDLNCGETYPALVRAVQQGLISEAEIDRAVTRLFTARFKLGMFDPDEMVPYAQIPIEINDAPIHRTLARQAALEAMVLLKNNGGLLPLSRSLKKLAVIGPNADDAVVLLGNYHGTPSSSVTPLQGILEAVSPQTEVLYARGCDVNGSNRSGFSEALAVARQADLVIFVGGLSQLVEGEEGQREGVTGGRSRGDRKRIELPGRQEELLKALHAEGKPLVLVLLNGSPVSIPWAQEHVPAILEAWYPGEEGGTAVAQVLFGDYNPAGRLPVTVYRSTEELPTFEDYDMQGRTYRYYRGDPLYPFGYGLSYTSFAYANLTLSREVLSPRETLSVQVEVTNTGERSGDEVVQLYVSDLESSYPAPIRQLHAFTRVHLTPGETQQVSFDLDPRQLYLIDDAGNKVVEPGLFELSVGGCQPGPAHLVPETSGYLTAQFVIQG